MRHPRTVAALASIPSRIDVLERTVESLYGQMEKVCVYLNGYEDTPAFLRRDRIEVVHSRDTELGDRGDVGKFYWVNRQEHPTFYFSCDDDILYPPDYAEHMLDMGTNSFGDASRAFFPMMGILGGRFRRPIQSYYRSRFPRYGVRFGLLHNVQAHFLGTGTTMLYTGQRVPDPINDFPVANMADVWLAVWANQHSVPMFCAARPADWLDPMPVKGLAIYDEFRKTGDDRVQTAAVTAIEWPILPPIMANIVIPPAESTAPRRRP